MDAIKEIIDAYRDRLKTPFTGAFTISWLGINYKLLVMIFSSESTLKKIEFIESYHSWWNSLWLPLISAFCVSTIPKVIMLIQEWSLRKVNKVRVGFAFTVSVSKKRQERVLAYFDKQIEIEKSGSKDAEELRKRVENSESKLKQLSQQHSDLNLELIQERKSHDKVKLDSEKKSQLSRTLFNLFIKERHEKYKSEIKQHSGSKSGELIIQRIDAFVSSSEPYEANFYNSFDSAFESTTSVIKASPGIYERLKGPFDFNLVNQNIDGEITLSVFGKYFKSALELSKNDIDPGQAISELINKEPQGPN